MKIHCDSTVRIGALALTIAAATWLVGCASGFKIERVAETSYPATSHIELIREEPKQPYEVLATIRGSETGFCSSDEPYCSLAKQARELGANAIWIQYTDLWTRPEQWVEIDGKMTRIRESVYQTISGVLIRYHD